MRKSNTWTVARVSRVLVAVLAVFVAGSSGLAAQDVTGTWTFSVDLGATGAGDATLVIEQEGESLSGTYTGALGEHSIHGTVKGDGVQIHLEVDEVGLVSYSGTITDAGIDGTCEYGQLGAGTFQARRNP